jgi:hypothetical protein
MPGTIKEIVACEAPGEDRRFLPARSRLAQPTEDAPAGGLHWKIIGRYVKKPPKTGGLQHGFGSNA